MNQQNSPKNSFLFQQDSQSRTLLEWLERKGVSLDTRCGSRGLCRGCRVTVDGQELRSCQVKTETIEEGLEIIPELFSEGKSVLHALDSFSMDWKPKSGRQGYGFAIDIGTTTVVVALWDLSKGELLDSRSSGNAQRSYGDNVLSRVQHDQDGGGSDLQRSLLKETLRPLIASLLKEWKDCEEQLKQVVIAGNPVMLHTMLGLSLEGFARFPFSPHFLGSRSADPELLGLRKEVSVELLPSMGAFVGADIVAGALSSGMINNHSNTLLIDFGTNGEILLRKGDDWLATATAVGPAFEGGVLACGRPADAMAVHHLDIVGEEWKLIGDQKEKSTFKGFSGSAYIDYISLCLQKAWINDRGRFTEKLQGVDEKDVEGLGRVLRHIFAPKLYITEVDLAELLKAKAAIQAGTEAILEEAGIEVKDLDQLVVAGGFGYHMDLDHAIKLGLIPQMEKEKIRIVGNASLGGASRVLLEEALLPCLEELSLKTEVIELNLLESFEDYYLDALSFEAQ